MFPLMVVALKIRAICHLEELILLVDNRLVTLKPFAVALLVLYLGYKA